MADELGAPGKLTVDGVAHTIHRLDAVDTAGGGPDVHRLPYSLKVLLENLLRHHDGVTVTTDDITALVGFAAAGEAAPGHEIAYRPSRVLMQDFTGVPAIVDLAAMRDAAADRGAAADSLEPGIPVDLVIDHSIQVDVSGRADALDRNTELEYERNGERYQFLRWGQEAFAGLKVVPPATGICHQVNLEHLATVVTSRDGVTFPDTLVGTDSHTPMVNGLGVVGWGVGGIEAEAALLGQPVSMLIPEVVGFRLSGELPEGTTATDLVLTVTEMLRHHGVVGRFVEFYGPGVANVPLENRATIGNMSPEYGSTVTMFPVDDETLRYLRFTGRRPGAVALVEAYAKEQGLWHEPDHQPTFTTTLELDLGTVEPSIAGPARPQDRVALRNARPAYRKALADVLPGGSPVSLQGYDLTDAGSFPASDPPAVTAPGGHDTPGEVGAEEPDGPAEPARGPVPAVSPTAVGVTLEDGTQVDVDHGHVAIAAITSCTNTSNPQVMVAAGLVARRAVERGLSTGPGVKTSLAPGSKVVVDYLNRSGLQPYLDKLGFDLVAFGCTTCIGNSGPLAPPISAAADDHGLALVSVLSGNRNFEGRINPDVRMNYLASPPLVVAYALAGTMDTDLVNDPLGTGSDGAPVYLADLWPTPSEVSVVVEEVLASEMFSAAYGSVFKGDDRWRSLPVAGTASGGGPDGGTDVSPTYRWDNSSTYVRRPPYLDDMPAEPAPLTDLEGARALARFGDSVTTDHISPAGAIHPDSPAGRWLQDAGVRPADFNSYGARRGNHEVMIRGTFANRRIRNHLAPGTEGGYTTHLPSGGLTTIYEAAERYRAEGVPLVVLAGREYGSGSSRDWAAKGTALLGVRAVAAESFERIHRSNLIGMGVLPLQVAEGAGFDAAGVDGTEVFSVRGLAGRDPEDLIGAPLTVRAVSDAGDERELPVVVRLDTPMEAAYYHHGGILPYVLRQNR